MINRDKIKPSDVAAHLANLPGMTEMNAWQLLDPSDKQNVPKAVTFLQSLLQLKDLPAPLTPSENQKRKALIFAAEMMGFFMRPFIEVDMDLANQLQNLATYPFLAVFYSPPWVSMDSSWTPHSPHGVLMDFVWTMVNFGEICLIECNSY